MRKSISLALVMSLLCTAPPATAEPHTTPTPLPGYTLRAAPDEIRVYAIPSTKANIVGYIIPGGSQDVYVLEVNGNWCYIAFTSVYGTAYGYVPLSCFDVALKPTPTPQPVVTYAAGTPAWIANSHEGYRLNLREKPSASASSLGKYYTGTPVTLTGIVQDGFAQVLLADSLLGWLDLRFLTFDPLSFSPETPLVTISNDGGGNLRSGPGTNFARLGKFGYGTVVTVLGVRSDGWYHVSVDEQIGYMSETVLSGAFHLGYGMDSDNPALDTNISGNEIQHYVNSRSNGGMLHLRKAASSSAKSLGLFYTGTPLTVLSYTRTGWAYVRIGQTEGYIDADYLTITRPTQCGEKRTVRNKRASGLNLRSAPSTGAEILTFVPNYSQLTVLGDLSDGWCYVIYEGQFGYMLGSSLESID